MSEKLSTDHINRSKEKNYDLSKNAKKASDRTPYKESKTKPKE